METEEQKKQARQTAAWKLHDSTDIIEIREENWLNADCFFDEDVEDYDQFELENLESGNCFTDKIYNPDDESSIAFDDLFDY